MGDGQLCVGRCTCRPRSSGQRAVLGGGGHLGVGGCASDDALMGRGIWGVRGHAGRWAVFLGCGSCAIDNTLAGSSILGRTWWCVGGMVGGRGGSATDDTVKAVDRVVQQTTRGLWAAAFGDMRRCCRGKGVGATGGVVGGWHALVGHDKQQSTKGDREGGVKPLTRWLVLRACSPG